jgi:hypothetical protein
MNNTPRTTDKGWSSNLVTGRGGGGQRRLTDTKTACYVMLHTALDLDRLSYLLQISKRWIIRITWATVFASMRFGWLKWKKQAAPCYIYRIWKWIHTPRITVHKLFKNLFVMSEVQMYVQPYDHFKSKSITSSSISDLQTQTCFISKPAKQVQIF